MLASSISLNLAAFKSGIYADNGGKIIPVHSSGPGNLPDAPSWFNEDGRASVASALLLCRSGRGDIIQLLPGHTENIATADAWSNLAATGVTIMGPAYGPPATFTWTTATSTMLMDTASFVIDGGPRRNIVFEMAGDPTLTAALSVAAPITMTGVRCGIKNVLGRMSIDADQLATIPLALSDAADDCFLENLFFYGATTGEVTTGIDIAGADRLRMYNCHVAGATSSTGVGIVRFKTTAATDIWLEENFYANRKAASAASVTGVAGVTGMSRNELFHYLDNSSTTMWVTSPGSMAFFNPRVANLAGESGMLATVVST